MKPTKLLLLATLFCLCTSAFAQRDTVLMKHQSFSCTVTKADGSYLYFTKDSTCSTAQSKVPMWDVKRIKLYNAAMIPQLKKGNYDIKFKLKGTPLVNDPASFQLFCATSATTAVQASMLAQAAAITTIAVQASMLAQAAAITPFNSLAPNFPKAANHLRASVGWFWGGLLIGGASTIAGIVTKEPTLIYAGTGASLAGIIGFTLNLYNAAEALHPKQ